MKQTVELKVILRPIPSSYLSQNQLPHFIIGRRGTYCDFLTRSMLSHIKATVLSDVYLDSVLRRGMHLDSVPVLK